MEDILEALSHKHSSWSEEKEIRIILVSPYNVGSCIDLQYGDSLAAIIFGHSFLDDPVFRKK